MNRLPARTAAALAMSAALALAWPCAVAALIDRGSYTIDTNTDLAWLDLTMTTGRVLSEVASGPLIVDGWRLARYSEVDALFRSNVGTSPVYITTDGFDSALALVRLLGVTGTNNSTEGVYNYYDPALSVTLAVSGYFIDDAPSIYGDQGYGVGGLSVYLEPGTGPSPPRNSAGWLAYPSYVTFESSNSGTGTFLVRAASTLAEVPEPASLPMALLGLLAAMVPAVGGAGRRSRT